VAEDYTYIVARLRAVEAGKPDRAWFERLARTPEASLLGSLREQYRAFESVSAPDEFERALETEKTAMLDLVTGLLRDERPREFIRARYDFDNLAHAWKASKLGAAPALTRFGLVPAETIAAAAPGAAGGNLPGHLERLRERLEAVYEETKSLAEATYAAEAAKWRHLLEIAPDDASTRCVRRTIDWINIRSFIRLRRTALRKETSAAVWLEGGEIETSTLAELFREEEDAFFSLIGSASCARFLGSSFSRETPLWMLDPLLRRAVMDVLAESRYRFFEFAPVLYHIELGEREFDIVRAVVVGALNRMGEERALERLDALWPS
jgi:vacuolar-type H+-ATPase subunit C/Vma6